MLVSLGMPSLVNSKPVAVPDSTVPSLSSDKPVSVPSSQPPSANDASPVNVAEQVTLVTPGQLLPTASSIVTPSQALQTASATIPPSKVASFTVPSSQATSVVPSSQATSSTASPLKVASSSVLSEEVQVIGENKAVKQREWKAKQPAVAPSGNKEPLLPAPKPGLEKVVVSLDSMLLDRLDIESMFLRKIA